MPDISPILSLPLIMPAQAQKHVTHNEALRLLDVMVQLAVLNRNLSAAPALPSVGDRHIVAAGAVGTWAGQVGKIALFTSTGVAVLCAIAGLAGPCSGRKRDGGLCGRGVGLADRPDISRDFRGECHGRYDEPLVGAGDGIAVFQRGCRASGEGEQGGGGGYRQFAVSDRIFRPGGNGLGGFG